MTCKEIDMPRHRREIVDLGERCVEEEIAEYELEQDAEIDERVGNKIKDNVVPFEKTREPGGARNDDRALEARQRLQQQHPNESERQDNQLARERGKSARDVKFRRAFDVVINAHSRGVARRAPGRNRVEKLAPIARIQNSYEKVKFFGSVGSERSRVASSRRERNRRSSFGGKSATRD